MRIRAQVKKNMGTTRHRVLRSLPDGSATFEDLPPASWVEIVYEDGDVFLFRYDSTDMCVSDTWHESVEAAKRQAAVEFGITEDKWHVLE
jgi:hypothetical protein